jgi:hypothetical protein
MLGRMPEMDVFTMVILLAVGTGFLFVLLVAVVRAGGCLQRIERLLEEKDRATEPAAPGPVIGRSSHGGEFRTFLREDATRQTLSKGEQFSAYRRWRKEKGLNWSKP